MSVHINLREDMNHVEELRALLRPHAGTVTTPEPQCTGPPLVQSVVDFPLASESSERKLGEEEEGQSQDELLSEAKEYPTLQTESSEEEELSGSVGKEPKARALQSDSVSASKPMSAASNPDSESDFDFDFDFEMGFPLPVMPTFSPKHFPAFKTVAIQAMQMMRLCFRFQEGKVPVEETIDLLSIFPEPNTTYDLWHQSIMKDLKKNAATWLREKTGIPSLELDGESLMTYYLEMLDEYFEPERRRMSLSEYARLKQGKLSPFLYYQKLQLMLPYIRTMYGGPEIAQRYVDGLNADVRERVVAKFRDVHSFELFHHLEEIAEYAQRIWIQAANSDDSRLNARVSKTRKGEMRAQSAKTTSRYYCSHHGPNSSHDSRDCRVLHGKRTTASSSADNRSHQSVGRGN
ncbi:hypothetical protein Vafri_4172 [Volvox africanus]|uniref:Retrotransposon gag domain-containing protein n=1 Tax=Volvox africanus TaxID=51714 RepID=A0A8J4ATH0_9CHLO|nr:hypothetical protein Vafri_4172 [Volvox africanus]